MTRAGRVAGRALGALALAGAALASGTHAAGALPADPAGSAAAGAPHQEPAGSAVRQAPTPPTPEAIPSGVELVEQSTWLQPGDRFEVELLVTHPPTGGSVQLVVHGPLASRAEFQRSLDGELGGVELTAPAQPLGSLGAPLGGRVTIGVGTGGEDGGADLGQGVHPVEVRLLDAAGETVGSLVTYAVIVPPDLAGLSPLAVSVIVDVSAPTALQPDGSVRMSSETLDRIGERVEALEQAAPGSVTVAPQPETLDGLDGAGSRGRRLLERLVRVSAGRPVLARPYTDVDLAALMDAGLVSEVNAQAEGGANVVRRRFGAEPAPGVWLPPGTVGEDAARMLVDLGVGRAVVPPAAVAEASERVPEEPVRLGDGGPVAMVTDSVLAERLTGDDMLDAERFVAELAMGWLERPGIQRGAVVRLPADTSIEPAVVARALDELAGSPVLRALPVTELFDSVAPVEGDAPPQVTPAPHEMTSDLAKLRGPIEHARREVGGITGLLGDPASGQSLEHSLLVATGIATPNDERRAYVERVTGELGNLTGLVDAPDEFRITLTSRSSTIPLNLTNNANRPIDVLVELESDQLEFPNGRTINVTLPPGATRLDIAVRTRASGAFPLDIRVTSPDGSITLDDTRFDIRSTTVSGVGLVLSLAAGLFLAVWWARHWRSAQRSRRLLPPDQVDGPPPPGGPGGDGAGAGDAAGADTGGTAPPPPPDESPRRRSRHRPAHLAGPHRDR